MFFRVFNCLYGILYIILNKEFNLKMFKKKSKLPDCLHLESSSREILMTKIKSLSKKFYAFYSRYTRLDIPRRENQMPGLHFWHSDSILERVNEYNSSDIIKIIFNTWN